MTPKGTFVINGAERVIVRSCTARRAFSSDKASTPTAPKSIPPGSSPSKAPGWNLPRTSTTGDVRLHRPEKEIPGHDAAARHRFDTDKAILDLFNLADDVPAPAKTWKNPSAANSPPACSKLDGRLRGRRYRRGGHHRSATKSSSNAISILDEENIELILDARYNHVILQRRTLKRIIHHLQYPAKRPDQLEMEAVNYIYRQLRGTDPPG
jgi:DNA-directed RNA polymerase subunit beta